MNSLRSLWLLIILIPFILIVDLIWLGIVMKGFYGQEIGLLMRKTESYWLPAGRLRFWFIS